MNASRFLHHAILLTCLGLGTPAKSQSADFTPHYSTVVPGLEYSHLQITNQPWSIHIARLDRKARGFDIVSTHGKGQIQGLAGLSQQIKALPATNGRPVAAINGDFFVIRPGPYQGDPAGLQIINRELISAPADKAFWSEPDGALHIGEVFERHLVTWPSGTKTKMALNQEPPADSATLFTPAFGHSTEAKDDVELILESAGSGPWLPLQVDETYRARVREVRLQGNSVLKSNQMVLTVTGTAKTNLSALKPGAILTFTTATSVDISKAKTGLGGGPLLLSKSKVPEQMVRKGGSTEPRHPRTAIGFNDDYFFLVAVDGRQKELSIGMSFVELASLMKQIGCTEALNLDGGGSTTFWLDGKVLNSPSDKRERSLANALMIVQQPK